MKTTCWLGSEPPTWLPERLLHAIKALIFNPGAHIPLNKHTANNSSSSAYENTSSHFPCMHHTHPLIFFCSERLVITLSVFTPLSPASLLPPPLIDPPLIGLIALYSLQTKSNRRMTITLERAIYLWFCFIFQLSPHMRAHVHAHLAPSPLSPAR